MNNYSTMTNGVLGCSSLIYFVRIDWVFGMNNEWGCDL